MCTARSPGTNGDCGPDPGARAEGHSGGPHFGLVSAWASRAGNFPQLRQEGKQAEGRKHEAATGPPRRDRKAWAGAGVRGLLTRWVTLAVASEASRAATSTDSAASA